MRIAAMKKLANILKTLISLEREAFCIDGKAGVDDLANSSITVSFVSASGSRALPDLLHTN